MPKYKNRKVTLSIFKAQISIISKGHLGFQKIIFTKRYPEKLVTKGKIESKIEPSSKLHYFFPLV
jgi:hypothetical protein